jgi:hypothetical protein
MHHLHKPDQHASRGSALQQRETLRGTIRGLLYPNTDVGSADCHHRREVTINEHSGGGFAGKSGEKIELLAVHKFWDRQGTSTKDLGSLRDHDRVPRAGGMYVAASGPTATNTQAMLAPLRRYSCTDDL